MGGSTVPGPSEPTWQAAFDPAPVAIVELSLDGTILRVNRAMEDLLETDAAALVGTKLSDYGHPAEGGLGQERLNALARGEAKGTALRHFLTAQGHDRWANALGLLISGPGSRPARLLDYLVDCTDAQLASQAVVAAQARFSALVEHSADAIVVQDSLAGGVVYASPGVSAILGLDPGDLIGSDLSDLVHPDDLSEAVDRRVRLAAAAGTSLKFECRLRHVDGRWRHLEVTTTNLIEDPAVAGVVHNLHDVTDRVQASARLAHQAMHDGLTGLPNRALFLDRLDQALARAERSGRSCALLYLDLDRFKQVNDHLGHGFGDQVLAAVAKLLHRLIRPGDSVARLGGDEFVVLAEGVDHPVTALAMAERIRATLAEPLLLGGRSIDVKSSIGVALAHRHAPDALLQEADLALYRAKDLGGNRWEMFDTAMRAQARRRLEVEDFIRSALDDKLLVPYYQPIVDLASGTVIGTEALAYIRGPDGTVFGPEHFITEAEDSGLIVALGAAMLDLACEQQARWCNGNGNGNGNGSGNGNGQHVAVNASARQLSSPDFVRSVTSALGAHNLAPERLCIELTETTLIDIGASTQSHLDDLKALGVVLALDDFGTGWSSLSHLRRFPIDVIKIDRSFVAGLGTNTHDSDLVRAVIDLGHALSLTIVAEGVENEEQLSLLRQLGCHRAQGYFLGRPQPASW